MLLSIIIIQLIFINCDQTIQKHILPTNFFQITYESLIYKYTIKSLDENREYSLLSEDEFKVLTEEEKRINQGLMGSLTGDFSIYPAEHKIAILKLQSDLIYEFYDRNNTVLFHTVIISEKSYKYIINFKKGPFSPDSSSHEMFFKYKSTMKGKGKTFIVSDDKDINIKLDKGVDLRDLMEFFELLLFNFDHLAELYSDMYKSALTEKRQEMLRFLFINNFLRFQSIRLSLRGFFKISYCDETVQTGIPFKLTIKNIIKKKLKSLDIEFENTEIVLKNLYGDMEKSGCPTRIIDKVLHSNVSRCTYYISTIKELRKQFLKNYLIKDETEVSKTPGDEYSRRRDLFEYPLNHQQMVSLKRFFKYFKYYIDRSIECTKLDLIQDLLNEIKLKENVLSKENYSFPSFSHLNLMNFPGIEKIEDLERFKMLVDLFTKHPSLENLSSLLADMKFKKLTIAEVGEDLVRIMKYMRSDKLISKEQPDLINDYFKAENYLKICFILTGPQSIFVRDIINKIIKNENILQQGLLSNIYQ